MKSSEFITENGLTGDNTQRLRRLKSEVESGRQPVVMNTSATADASVYTMGDLEALGWMDKEYHTNRRGPRDSEDEEFDVDWTRHYFGPKPIRVQTLGSSKLRTISKGDSV